jgi:hypothetical protein
MKGFVRTAVVLCLAGSLVIPGVAAAGADELCPMGGAMVKVAVDQDKAAEWLDDERRAYLPNEEGQGIRTFSEASGKIGLVLTEEFVFFGVADDRDDREADEKRMTKAFGNGLKFLRNAVQKEVKAMWKAQVIDINGSDVQAISEAVGLGVISQDGRDWVLETADCEGMTINLEDLD